MFIIVASKDKWLRKDAEERLKRSSHIFFVVASERKNILSAIFEMKRHEGCEEIIFFNDSANNLAVNDFIDEAAGLLGIKTSLINCQTAAELYGWLENIEEGFIWR